MNKYKFTSIIFCLSSVFGHCATPASCPDAVVEEIKSRGSARAVCKFLSSGKNSNRFLVLENYETPKNRLAGVTLSVFEQNIQTQSVKALATQTGLGTEFLPLNYKGVETEIAVETLKGETKIIIRTFSEPQLGAMFVFTFTQKPTSLKLTSSKGADPFQKSVKY
jgi:hypothetical protein